MVGEHTLSKLVEHRQHTEGLMWIRNLLGMLPGVITHEHTDLWMDINYGIHLLKITLE
jgi:hypothetical protein